MTTRTRVSLWLAVAAGLLLWRWLDVDLEAAARQQPAATAVLPATAAPAADDWRLAGRSPPAEDTSRFLQRVALASPTGHAHRRSPATAFIDPLGRDVPALLAAADQGDHQAAVYAAELLLKCSLNVEVALEHVLELAAKYPTPARQQARDYLDGRRNPKDPSVRLEPLLRELEEDGVRAPQMVAYLTSDCRGATIADLRRSATVIERAARGGNEDAKLLFAERWPQFAGLQVGVLNATYSDTDRKALTLVYPETAAMPDRAQGYLVEAAHAGNLDAIRQLWRDSTFGIGPMPPSAEQGYFWKLVLHYSAPGFLAGEHASLVAKIRELNTRPIAGDPPMEEPPPFDLAQELAPESNGVLPARAAGIRAAAEALALQCCR